MKKTILIIDDDPDILITTSSILRKRDYSVLEAKSAEEALDILKENIPDLILTDVLLPNMNGYEFVKNVKKCSATCDIPILVITGRGQMKETFDVLGTTAFISKPFSPNELIVTVDEILDIKEFTDSDMLNEKKRFLIVGRKEFQDILEDITDVIKQLRGESVIALSVSDAVAKVVDFSPHALISDVQLDGKHSAELVNIVRHLPNFEQIPILGFCYYPIDSLDDDEVRSKIMNIQSDVDKFLCNGANHYMDRYARGSLINEIKEKILTYDYTKNS